MIAPVIEKLTEEYAGKFKFCKLNVDSNSAAASQYSIMSIPTLLLFNQGKLVDQIVGAVPKQHLVSRLETLLDQ
jgi:thioredoxin 1